AINYGNSLGVASFNDAVKTNVLAGKIARKFASPNSFNNNAGNATSMKALISNKFLSIDTPETYKKRIRPYVNALPFANALPILYSHLSENLKLRIKIGNPADLNTFFTQLNDKWLETGRRVGVSSFSEETLSHSSI
ncbi:17473_t:CDS:2, partial [Funneliformis caledonium]